MPRCINNGKARPAARNVGARCSGKIPPICADPADRHSTSSKSSAGSGCGARIARHDTAPDRPPHDARTPRRHVNPCSRPIGQGRPPGWPQGPASPPGGHPGPPVRALRRHPGPSSRRVAVGLCQTAVLFPLLLAGQPPHGSPVPGVRSHPAHARPSVQADAGQPAGTVSGGGGAGMGRCARPVRSGRGTMGADRNGRPLSDLSPADRRSGGPNPAASVGADQPLTRPARPQSPAPRR